MGDPAKATVKKEMIQLHMCNTFQPRHWKTLSPEEKERLLELHLFLKKKRCGKIKVDLGQVEINRGVTLTS
jgi:hypothetical protein